MLRDKDSPLSLNETLVAEKPIRLSKKVVLRLVQISIILSIIIFAYQKYHQTHQDNLKSQHYLASPKVDDIYFLDFRLLESSLRPKEKYRLAKVVDITGDVVTLLYGNMFFLRQQAAIDSIRYGQLRYKDYFEKKRYDFSREQLAKLYDSAAIYAVKRPKHNMLYGNYINEPNESRESSIFIPGKRENHEGLSLLKSDYLEDNLQQAFERFEQSASLGFAEGKVNLGEMYLNGHYVNKDLSQSLYWFKQAALQSNKAGVLKYVIVCRQLEHCYEQDFYQALYDAGVNIKVRKDSSASQFSLKTQ